MYVKLRQERDKYTFWMKTLDETNIKIKLLDNNLHQDKICHERLTIIKYDGYRTYVYVLTVWFH